MYQALYRKWRPETFDEVVGQNQITDTLKYQVASGHLSHAYLFIGSRGTGKTTCARILARAVNCDHPAGGNPCCQCSACRSILDGSAPEIVEIDAASNNGVDDVRALRDEAIYSPAVLKKRVYIIDEVHMLSKPAFNALLKILEEPPEHLIFVLATTELSKVPATILSRCQRFSFKRIPMPLIKEHLLKIAAEEGLKLTSGAAELLAVMAEGGMRDALSLLDQCASSPEIDEKYINSCLGLADNYAVESLLDAVFAKDSGSAVSGFNGLWIQGKDPASVLKEISGLLRDVLLYKILPPDGGGLVSGGFDPSVLKKYSDRHSSEELIALMETLESKAAQMRDSSDPKITAELCLITLCDDRAQDSLYAVRARLDRLENTVAKGVAPAAAAAALPVSGDPVIEEEPESVSLPKPEELPPAEQESAADETAGTEPAAEPEGKETTEEEKYLPVSVEAPAAGGADFDLESAVKDIASAFPMGTRVIMTDPSAAKWELDGDFLRIAVKTEFNRKALDTPDKRTGIEKRFEELFGRKVKVVVSGMQPEQRNARDIEELKRFDIVQFK